MSFNQLQSLTNNQTSVISDPSSAGEHSLIGVQVNYTDATPALKTFLDGDVTVGADSITITSHGFITGVLGRLTTTGVLPAGLSLATDYFVIKVDDNTIKLASTYANSLAGTAVDITAAAGTGTHTFTPTAVNAVFKLQSSIDGSNWVDIAGETVTITATGSTIFSLVDFTDSMIRTNLTQTSGQGVLNITTSTNKRIK